MTRERSCPIVFGMHFDGASALTIEQLWPDGDAPEHPTVQDVIELMIRDGHAWRSQDGHLWVDTETLVEEWGLDADITITITGPGGPVRIP